MKSKFFIILLILILSFQASAETLKIEAKNITLDKDNIMVEDFFKQHGVENKLPLYLLVQDGKYTFYDEKYFYKD